MDDLTRRRLTYETADYYRRIFDITAANEPAGDQPMPWASARQDLFTRAVVAGSHHDMDEMLLVLGEFDDFWEQVQRIQAGFSYVLLAALTSVGADLDSVLDQTAAGVSEFVNGWAKAVAAQ